jgi:2-oxoacid dehydrogenases acyltransferase (catalytic domain)
VTDYSPRVVPGNRKPDTRSAIRRVGSSKQVARDRIALATWRRSTDARIGCTIVLEWDRISAMYPNMVPVSVAGFALAHALAKNPLANRRVVLWRLRNHKSVRISFAVDAIDHLRIAVVDKGDQLDPRRFQHALRVAVRDARNGIGPLQRMTRLLEHLPVAIGSPILKVWSFLSSGLGIAFLGVDGAPFGAAMLSSNERFQLPAVDVPFIPFTRCTMVCSIGAISPAVITRNGVATVVDTVNISVSFDHRICDGGQIADLLDDFLEACYAPPPCT